MCIKGYNYIIERINYLGGVNVLQYHTRSNPISIFSLKGSMELKLNDFTGENQNLANFRKRCIMQDVNKTIFDYIFKKKSDYFVLDILDARLPLMRKDNCYITKEIHVKYNEMPEYLGLSMYEEISPFTDINIKQWKLCMDNLADVIQAHYKPNQIILNIHYGVKEFKNGSVIQNFKTADIDFVDTYNKLIYQLFEMLKENLKGCHVIEFPDNVISDREHWLGLHPLHYHKFYYDYAGEAIKVILCNLPDNEEKEKLEHLRILFSERFENLQMKIKFGAIKRKSEWRNQALMFMKALALDFYGNGNFTNWLIENQGKKVAVLKCADTAGEILLEGLKKYKFNVVFSTQAANFDGLTEDQISLCRDADIIISANVHPVVAPQRDGIKAVNIYDLLKSKKGI